MSLKNSRKRLYVDSQVQGSLLRQLLVHWSMACFLVFLYLLAMQTLKDGFEMSFRDNLATLWRDYSMIILILLVISPVFIYDSIKLSNRFVGPMISFRAAMKKLADGGDPGDISFRQNDFWREMTNDFNRISAEMRERRVEEDLAADDEVGEPVGSA